jgi:hypothetical protein
MQLSHAASTPMGTIDPKPSLANVSFAAYTFEVQLIHVPLATHLPQFCGSCGEIPA